MTALTAIEQASPEWLTEVLRLPKRWTIRDRRVTALIQRSTRQGIDHLKGILKGFRGHPHPTRKGMV